jgi:hypothetical protein
MGEKTGAYLPLLQKKNPEQPNLKQKDVYLHDIKY